MKSFLLNRRALCVLLIFLIVFVSYAGVLLAFGGSYSVYVNLPEGSVPDAAVVNFGEDGKLLQSDYLTVKDIKIHDRYVKAVFTAESEGSETVTLRANVTRADGAASRYVAVENIKIIKLAGNFVFNNLRRQLYAALAVLSLLLCVYYFYLFIMNLKSSRCSYNCSFFLSVSLVFALMLAMWCGISGYSLFVYHTASSAPLYTVTENIMTAIVLITLPFSILFAFSVSLSNIQLMRKEGVRPANMLGIGVSAAMLAGLAAIIALMYFHNEYKDSALISIVHAVTSSLYVLFEVVLISTVFCGIYAARFEPAYDKDYIIILGCMIKKDGTLYPLLRGRVDRAIKFYNSQLKQTGKKAVFIPSGGQGDDEIMPEAEAIKNYLVEQGIPEDRIIPETKSTTTFENMSFSKSIIKERGEGEKTVYSTTSYHVFRSGIIASQAGLEADGIGSKTKWYFWPNAFLREVAGLFVRQPKKQILIILGIAVAAGVGSFLYSLL